MTCIDCGDDNAYDDWELFEGMALCCDCAGERCKGNAPPEWFIDLD